MAFIKASETKEIRKRINERFPKKDGYKFSIRTRNHSSLDITILEAPFTFGGVNNVTLGPWMEQRDNTTKEEIEFYRELRKLGEGDNYFDESDLMSDYVHVKHYVFISVGAWNKPFVSTRDKQTKKMEDDVKTKIVERSGISSDRLVFSIVR